MPVEVQAIDDRWALAWPTRIRQLEVQGALLDRLREQYELGRAALERASGDDYTHLAEHENLELLGPPIGP